MSVRSLGYDNAELDGVIRYFMRTILHLQKAGMADLPLELDLREPLKSYLSKAMKLLIGGASMELSQLILNAEYDAIVSSEPVNVETALSLRLIKELSLHIHFDDDNCGYLFSTAELWGNAALEYASMTFYPNLPAEIGEKYHIPELIAYIPQDRFRLNDY